jgi:acetyl-CoA synthetase
MVGAGTSCKYLFDLRPGDVYWCTADCGWITGHTYLTYGPLLNGVTQVLFGSTPAYPDAGRCWRIVEKYSVSLF